jgi:protein-disulfide isomerase
MIRKNSILLSVITSLGFIPSMVLAQTAEIPSMNNMPSESVLERFESGSIPPALQYLIDSGVSLTFLGDAGGILGYLGESPSGNVQTFYLTPDGKHVVAGVLFKQGGVNVSGIQINDMKNRFEQARKNAERASEDIKGINIDSNVAPRIPDTMTEVTPTDIKNGEAAIASKETYLSNRDIEEFKTDLDQAAWFSVGAGDAPVLYMLADPQCPFCHKAWQEIRPMIMSREISVRVILVAGLQGSEPRSISILSRDEPGRAWFAGEGSTKSMPIAPPPGSNSEEFQRGRGYLNTNMTFMEKHNLDATPFFFTFDKEGDLYESRGWPEDSDLFFSILRG